MLIARTALVSAVDAVQGGGGGGGHAQALPLALHMPLAEAVSSASSHPASLPALVTIQALIRLQLQKIHALLAPDGRRRPGP